ncbi:hypothetical protein EPN96_01120 [bacterium]|nr:MAG: hypothetical protein EPN96_01120 [bacterium]
MKPTRRREAVLRGLLHLFWVLTLAFFFAKAEIQIEGANGWASNLPTWRVEGHVLLGLFWGGRTLTGYHAWIFSFMALVFHTPLILSGKFARKLWSRSLGSLMLFWIAEDFIWFALNPAYGIAKLAPQFVPWHKNWLLGWPSDYLTFSTLGALLILYSLWPAKRQDGENARQLEAVKNYQNK